MSDEPKRLARPWFGWALLSLLVLYPLSMGPVCWFAPESSDEIVEKVYAPIDWIRSRSETVDNAVVWYTRLLDR
ncbi:MAG TPA: hypothetical protein VGP76_03970 [Planctomycetaceae bacterium]|nr:hypothetical protein [Planctomycetaceae bacterium]